MDENLSFSHQFRRVMSVTTHMHNDNTQTHTTYVIAITASVYQTELSYVKKDRKLHTKSKPFIGKCDRPENR